MRDASAAATPERLNRFWAPNVLHSVLGVASDLNRSDVIERPERAIAAADRAVAIYEFLWRFWNLDPNRAAVASTYKHGWSSSGA